MSRRCHGHVRGMSIRMSGVSQLSVFCSIHIGIRRSLRDGVYSSFLLGSVATPFLHIAVESHRQPVSEPLP
jgi:hypothetical protein